MEFNSFMLSIVNWLRLFPFGARGAYKTVRKCIVLNLLCVMTTGFKDIQVLCICNFVIIHQQQFLVILRCRQTQASWRDTCHYYLIDYWREVVWTLLVRWSHGHHMIRGNQYHYPQSMMSLMMMSYRKKTNWLYCDHVLLCSVELVIVWWSELWTIILLE